MAQRTSSEGPSEQYSLAKIVGIWALAAAPMGILGWIAFPATGTRFRVGSSRIRRHEGGATDAGFGLVVCPFHDYCASRGR